MNPGFELDADEVIVRRIRRHWIDMVSPVVMALGLFAAGIGLAVGAGFYSRLAPAIPAGSVDVVSLLLIGLGSLVLLIGYWSYLRNFMVLTNKHLVEVKQIGLFGHEVSQLGLGRLQDVTAKRNGLWPTLLNYGDVLVQSAGETGEFLFQHVPDPQQVAEICQQAHDDYLRGNQSPAAEGEGDSV